MMSDIPNLPDESCDECGAHYDTVYRLPDLLWERISGRDDGGGKLCPACCDRIAREKGIELFWEALEDVHPSGKRFLEQVQWFLRRIDCLIPPDSKMRPTFVLDADKEVILVLPIIVDGQIQRAKFDEEELCKSPEDIACEIERLANELKKAGQDD
jgi:hypothetical protein